MNGLGKGIITGYVGLEPPFISVRVTPPAATQGYALLANLIGHVPLRRNILAVVNVLSMWHLTRGDQLPWLIYGKE